MEELASIASMPIRFSTAEWPVVVTTLEGSMSESDTAAYLSAFLAEVIGQRRRFVSIVDARALVEAPSAKVRRMIAEWEQGEAASGAQYNAAIAFVTDSALIRGAMTALHWMSPPKTPTTYVATMEAARAFALSRLTDAEQASAGES